MAGWVLHRRIADVGRCTTVGGRLGEEQHRPLRELDRDAALFFSLAFGQLFFGGFRDRAAERDEAVLGVFHMGRHRIPGHHFVVGRRGLIVVNLRQLLAGRWRHLGVQGSGRRVPGRHSRRPAQ